MSQTTEIQIQNQNGLSFRTKLNQMLSALNTVFAGTTAPTVTEAYMHWLDTSVTPNVLRRRNSSDTAWELMPVVEGETNAATAKTTPVDADVVPLVDSAAGNALKKLAWANIKATLKAYFDTLYVSLSGGNLTGPVNANKGANIASAATTNIAEATGEYVVVTGTTAITAFGTAQAGAEREVRFANILTLTHNATSLILPTASNITTAAGDCATFRSEGGGNWCCVKYQRADGTSLGGTLANQRITLTASVATTSGTSVDFTSIPSWAKKITVIFDSISTNGGSVPQIQLGAGSVQVSGYSATASIITSGQATLQLTSGFPLVQSIAAAWVIAGNLTLCLHGDNKWVASGSGSVVSGATASNVYGGRVTLSSTLDRIRLTTVGGTDTFDAGSVSLLIEGY